MSSPIRFWRLPGKSAQTTRELVRDLAQVYGAHPGMRRFVVLRVLRPAGVATRDELAAVRAIWRWVRDNVAFWNEAGEQVLTPARVIIDRFGDCDDRSALLGAMLTAIRIRVDFPLLARRTAGRLVPYHIWARAHVRGHGPVDLETCHPDARFGEHPAALTRRIRGLSL